MSGDNKWVELTSCQQLYQAEMLAQILGDAGIPTLAQGPQAGVFGYGFGASTPQGISLRVPADRLDQAREILEQHPPL
jgi:hypothetical protein